MQRLKLHIKKQDGSTYWVAYFDYRDRLNSWLSEEKQRPYWDASYVSDVYLLDDYNNETLLEGNV